MTLEIYKRHSPILKDFWEPFFNSLEGNQSAFSPAVDVRETKEAYIIEADLPGMEEKDIALELQEGVLTISGTRQHQHEEKTDSYWRRERSYGSFQRSFTIGNNVDVNKIAANYKKGTLFVTLPKSTQEKAKRIPIQ